MFGRINSDNDQRRLYFGVILNIRYILEKSTNQDFKETIFEAKFLI